MQISMFANLECADRLHSTSYKLAKKIKKIKSSQALKPAGRGAGGPKGRKRSSSQAFKRVDI